MLDEVLAAVSIEDEEVSVAVLLAGVVGSAGLAGSSLVEGVVGSAGLAGSSLVDGVVELVVVSVSSLVDGVVELVVVAVSSLVDGVVGLAGSSGVASGMSSYQMVQMELLVTSPCPFQ